MSIETDDPNRTIHYESTVGKRLSKVHKPGTMYIVFQGKRLPIVSRTSIGRGEDNSIVLEDILASRQHAIIQKVKEEYFIQDLGSTNGTFLNGQSVPPWKYMRINHSDIVLIGRTELSLQHLK
jgi:pSer/pThr/pTyr-binding forkhead associated (FHA) protein